MSKNNERHGVSILAFAAVVVVTAALIGRQILLHKNDPNFANPYDDPYPIMQGIYVGQSGSSVGNADVRAVIVPHHIVAAESIARGIYALTSRSDLRRIILISPDHYGVCANFLCTTNGGFQTLFGTTQTDSLAVRTLALSALVDVQPPLFEKEHGIYAVLPFIAKALPSARVVPIVISQERFWRIDKAKLIQTLEPLLDSHTAIVVSSDFSHYLPVKESDILDDATEKTLLSRDMNGIAALKNPDQSDCPGCLYLLGALADRGGFYNLSVLAHTNSARILGDESVTQTTSHFAIAFYQSARLTPDDATFAGDVTVTRGRAAQLSKEKSGFWSGSGTRVVNLEGPIGTACSGNKNPYIFCNSYVRWEEIAGLATHWSVVNNHMLDHGARGLQETQDILRRNSERSLLWFPTDEGNLRLFAVTSIMNPVPDFATFDIAARYRDVLDGLRASPADKFKVVVVHAGAEYDALSTDLEKKYMRSFIDAGADAVVAMHSHVPGDMEIYKGRPIFHGLGNFVFDQGDTVPTSTAMMVRLRKTGDKVLFETKITR